MEYIRSLSKNEELNNNTLYMAGNNKFAVRLNESFPISIVDDIPNLFVIINKIFHNGEIEDLKNYLSYLKTKRIKGIFFSDFAIYNICKELDMLNLLIYDPITYIVNYHELDFFIGKIKGVVISPFISLEELKQFDNSNIELFYLGNGRIPLFYSKRHLIKNYLKYHEIEDFLERNNLFIKEELRPDLKFPIEENENGTFVYSPYIFSSLDLENELKNINYLIIDYAYDKKFIKGDNLGFLDRKVVYRKEG